MVYRSDNFNTRRGIIARRLRLFILLAAAFTLFLAFSTGINGTRQTRTQAEEQAAVMKTSYELSNSAQSQESYNLDEIYTNPTYRGIVQDFFTQQTGSTKIAEYILRESERHQLPVSLTFALAWVESRFDPLAVNYNQNSIDRGVFQLNNRSFPNLRESQFFNPEENIVHGVAYLKYCLEQGENQVTALAMYNAGPRRVNEQGAPRMTLEHINKILEYREQLQQEFEASLKVASVTAKPGKSGKNTTNVVDRNKLSK